LKTSDYILHLSSLVRAKISKAERGRRVKESSDIILLYYKKGELRLNKFLLHPLVHCKG